MIKLISHIILSLLLLVSTTGFTIDRHLCNDELIDTAVFAKANSCCDPSMDSKDQHSNHQNCMNCENEVLHTNTVDIFVPAVFEFNYSDDFILLPYLLSHNENLLHIGNEDEISLEPEPEISPPGTSKKLSLVQSYLL